MLQAKLNNGKLVTLARLPKQIIEQYRRRYNFFCPVCDGSVIIKAGEKTIPHFAHARKANCLSQGGGEGSYHNKGKLLLYQWLKSQHLHVALEKYLPDIQQQPDVLLSVLNRKIAIEFQCARISATSLKQRIAGYKKLNIQSIWILGANQFQRHGSAGLKVDAFIRLFIHQLSSQQLPKLYFFCPQTEQLIIFQDFYHTHLNKAIGHYTITNLKQLTLKDLFRNIVFPKEVLLKQWAKEKRAFRLRRHSSHISSSDRKWQQWLYLKQTHKEHVSSVIYLPVTNHFKMKSPPWNWQSRLCLDFLEPMEIGDIFSVNDCIQFLCPHIYEQHVFPLISSQSHPVLNYLQILEKLNILQKQSDGGFMKERSLIHHKHIEQSMQGDKVIMNELFRRLTFSG